MYSASTRKQTVKYSYDALGRRVKRHIPGGRENTKFIYDGLDVLVDDNGGTLTKYLNADGIDNKLRQTTGSTTNYFIADHLGSTNVLTSSTGSLIASNSYDSFGNSSNVSFPSRYQFTGREYDSFTGLQFSRARYYDPNLGRFISEDPIGFGGGDVNLFGYVRNNPINLKDPTGKLPIIAVVVVGGAIAAELALHIALMEYADSIHFSGSDPWGRKRHCWVNCMSTRIHLGNPAVPTVLGVTKEVHDVTLRGLWDDSKRDMQANLDGQLKAYLFWKGCQELCDDCQY